ncbi:hypothetical protein [Aminipila luticellarii]|uniref:Type II secretion system protein GspF domain-containing protein n=1 Tax=Aminipila luticellarii TaxID=2507160 RepID=A0A410PWB1_9FIRM|nr:hypothetical protein [Aminipila luticellarii]QAT43180.1 hypothetical protein EQM06_07960 [Aminipila luticellarii]
MLYREKTYLKRGTIRDLRKSVQEWSLNGNWNRRLGAWKRRRKEQLADKEIYEAISFLRNIISIDRGKQVGTDFIIEQLADRDGVLQEVYIRMLSLLRVNKREEAQKIMADHLETPVGKEFAGLLLRWDEVNPLELSEILLSHQRSIKEIRMTQQRKKDEIISDMLYFPVIINVVFIFINFIYVGYFINQKEVLQMLF